LHKLFKNTVFVGKKAFYLPSCHSTNELASVLLTDEQPLNGTVIYTDYQTKGKGQRGNSWESDDGKNILASIILDTKFLEPSDFFDLTIITSLAIHDFLAEYLKEDLKIKWPNDLMYEDKKIGGILIENYIKKNVIEWCVVGVGLNINQDKFLNINAISLASICGQKFDREELTNLLLLKIEDKYFQLKKGKINKLRKEYLENLYWRDEIHVFQSEGTFFNGRIIDVENSGKLRMELDEGERLFDFKEVVFIK
jgi:BirA family biotin operon repressor/biotin-[acetyl-CoA-carboxylase] ligase